MGRPIAKFRKKLVEQCRARIEAGVYDAPGFFESTLSKRRLIRMLDDINACPIGDGDRYRDATAEFFSGCLQEVVDQALVKMEFPCHGSRGDIELPLRLEELGNYPLWMLWANRYAANSIIIEVKNEADKTDCAAVQQIDSYLNRAGRGRLGFLVSRVGFTKNASEQLSHIAVSGENLILPFTHHDLSQVAKARRDGFKPVMQYFRRKQTLLMQTA